MKKPLPVCLLLLRIGVFVALLIWAIDKFFRPGAEASALNHFYHLPVLPSMVIYTLGAFEILLATCFLIGIQKTLTYALVFLITAAYTIAAYRFYWPPFQGDNLLFFSAWPMLMGCLSLYILRKQDTLLSIS